MLRSDSCSHIIRGNHQKHSDILNTLQDETIKVGERARLLYLFCESAINLQKRSTSSPVIGEIDRAFLANSCNLDELQKLPALSEIQTDSDLELPISPVTSSNEKRRSIFFKPKANRNSTLTASPINSNPSPKNSPATGKRGKKKSNNRVLSFIGSTSDRDVSFSEDDTTQEKPADPTLDDPVLISKSLELLKRSFNQSKSPYWDSLLISISLYKMNQLQQAVAIMEDQRVFIEMSQLTAAFNQLPVKGQAITLDLLQSAITFFSFVIFASRICQRIELYMIEGFVDAATQITNPALSNSLRRHEDCTIPESMFHLVEKEIASRSATLKFEEGNEMPNVPLTDLDEL